MFKRIRDFVTQISFTPVEREIYALLGNDFYIHSPHRNSFRGKYELSEWDTYEITFPRPELMVTVSSHFVEFKNKDDKVSTPVSNSFRWFVHELWVKARKKSDREYEAKKMNDALAYVKKNIT